jgi:E3 ubiquitin-protein ligase MARCH6
MRPGAMWFIKDPQDQNFHPIRDILERPTLTHLRKLMISAEMYSAVIIAGVGSVGGLMKLFTNVLPFRWTPQYVVPY